MHYLREPPVTVRLNDWRVSLSVYPHPVAYPEEGKLGDSNSPIESSDFSNVCLHKILSKLCSYTHSILNVVLENVKNCTYFHIFASASGGRRAQAPDPRPGLCPWTPLGDFRPQIPLLGSF